MQLQQLEEHLNSYLNVVSIKDYCPNGLQLEGKREIKKIGTAVSANLDTIEKAISENVDALIVHHGLFWEKESYCLVGVKKKKIELLLKHEISLLAYHLPLDAHPNVGNNWHAAQLLGWKDLKPFGNYNGTLIGVKGSFESLPIESLIRQLEDFYQHKAMCALGGKKSVETAALISGGAYKELSQAALEGVDCYITGNFDEPAWSSAFENQIHFLALGHSATERVGPKALCNYIQKELGISSIFIESPNPF